MDTRALALLLRRVKRSVLAARGCLTGSRCPACGRRSVIVGEAVLWPELIADWELSPEWVRWFNEREGLRCSACHASLRSRQLAEGLLAVAREMSAGDATSLKALCVDPTFCAMSIAELNAAGDLHRFLSALPNLRYSEYGSTSAAVPSEDLLALSYPSASFDLVISSETLEHVADVKRALREIRRVLKPGGWHVFTVPVVLDQTTTRRRASLRNGKVVHDLPPSYHDGAATGDAADLLVFYEFGSDFLDECAAAGFEVRMLQDSRNQALVTFLSRPV
jgi:SAM-dependent methyltransferase